MVLLLAINYSHQHHHHHYWTVLNLLCQYNGVILTANYKNLLWLNRFSFSNIILNPCEHLEFTVSIFQLGTIILFISQTQLSVCRYVMIRILCVTCCITSYCTWTWRHKCLGHGKSCRMVFCIANSYSYPNFILTIQTL